MHLSLNLGLLLIRASLQAVWACPAGMVTWMVRNKTSEFVISAYKLSILIYL